MFTIHQSFLYPHNYTVVEFLDLGIITTATYCDELDCEISINSSNCNRTRVTSDPSYAKITTRDRNHMICIHYTIYVFQKKLFVVNSLKQKTIRNSI